MRLERARTSRLRHRLLARKIILFRLLPLALPARRRLALDTARWPSTTRRARHLGASLTRRFHRPSRPARLRGAAAIGEIDQRIISESVPPRASARGDATGPSHRRHDVAPGRSNSALGARRSIATSRVARRVDPRAARASISASRNFHDVQPQRLARRLARRARVCGVARADARWNFEFIGAMSVGPNPNHHESSSRVIVRRAPRSMRGRRARRGR